MANARRNQCYQKGLADEAIVKDFLKSRGYTVDVSSSHDNKANDIDCWVNDQPVSIKSQHKGESFRNIGFELCNHLTAQKECEVTKEILSTELTLNSVITLLQAGSWEPAWYMTGTATHYLFYQGQSLRLYRKKDIEALVNSQGFLRIRPLTEDTRSYLGGTYRHCNSICGYLNWNDVIHRKWSVPQKDFRNP